MMRTGWIALLVVVAVASAAVGHAAGTAAHPTTLTGHDWNRFEPAEREAYLAGFAAGAAAMQVMRGQEKPDGARVATQVARTRENGALTFPFAPNVYAASMADYFFYRDRLGQTLIQAMVELNEIKKTGGR